MRLRAKVIYLQIHNSMLKYTCFSSFLGGEEEGGRELGHWFRRCPVKLREGLRALGALGLRLGTKAANRWHRLKPGYRFASVLLVVLVVVAALGLSRPNAGEVWLDGERIGVVRDAALVTKVLSEIEKQLEDQGKQVELKSELRICPTRAPEEALVLEDELREIVARKARFWAWGTAIVIDGKQVCVVPDEEAARKALELATNSLVQSKPNWTLESVRILEEVGFEPWNGPVENICSYEQAKNILIRGSQEYSTCTIKEGDNFWTIARAHGLNVEDLKRANPGVREDRLQIGQQIKLSTGQPLIHAEATYTVRFDQAIPYQTEYRYAADRPQGYSQVEQRGAVGTKSIAVRLVQVNGVEVSRQTVGETVIKEPVNQVVVRGTKKIQLASRSGGGRLVWPLTGQITSGYGYRGKEFHPAIDIAGSSGEPIRAAEAGRVIFAGWSGGYGRLVTIDHGGGLVTRYAHMSGFAVSVGDKVKQGEVIGYVGSSGNATGSHLHFEVLVDGDYRNPLNYLR